MNYQYLDTPIGALRLVSNGRQLTGIEFEGQQHGDDGTAASDSILSACAAQLIEYFSGGRREFELPLAASGTPFQQSVWRALVQIPYGEVCSYRELAERIGKPTAARAVGAANGRNPLPIVVPCHRVIGSSGALTGFAGGLARKNFLLELEGALPAKPAR